MYSEFLTKVNFDNRQVVQYPETSTIISGGTQFGVPYSSLPYGTSTTLSATTYTATSIVSTYSGNTGITNYTFSDSNMDLGIPYLPILTNTNSGSTFNTGNIFVSATTTNIEGRDVVTSYTGVSFDIYCITMTSSTGTFIGSATTNTLYYISSMAVDYSGSTVWIDCPEILQTSQLRVTKNAVNGYALTCKDSTTGLLEYSLITGNTNLWSAGTGLNSVVMNNNNGDASGNNSLALNSYSIASGDCSFSGGKGFNKKPIISAGISCFNFSYNNTGQISNAGCIGDYSTILGGLNQNISKNSLSSSIISGKFNDIQSASLCSVIAGGNNVIGNNCEKSAIIGGAYNYISPNLNSVILLGKNNFTATTSATTFVDTLNIGNVAIDATYLYPLYTTSGGTVVTNPSDEKFKTDIKIIDNPLEKLLKIEGVTYKFKNDLNNKTKYGFIAQQLEKVVNEFVIEHPDGTKLVQHIDIIPLIIESIKELYNNKSIYLTEAEHIVAEDNDILLNYNGNNMSAINGGIKIHKGIDDYTDLEITVDENGYLLINSYIKPNNLLLRKYTPSNNKDINMIDNEICFDDNYLYVKSNNKIKRVILEDF